MGNTWEDRKPRKNGDTMYVNIPKAWLQDFMQAMDMDFMDFLDCRFVFARVDGKHIVRFVKPSERE